ncbi:MAG: PAS-domain containing protein [Paracoccaceae bacterium]
MLDLPAQTVAIVTILSVLAAAAIILGYGWLESRKHPLILERINEADNQLRFLFDGMDLIDSTAAAKSMLEIPTGQADDTSEWNRLREMLLPRYSTFPTYPEDVLDSGRLIIPSDDIGAQTRVELEALNGNIRVTMIDENITTANGQVNTHRLQLAELELNTLRRAIQGAPYPVWQTNSTGTVTWANDAYRGLSSSLKPLHVPTGGAITHIFSLPEHLESGGTKVRLSLNADGSGKTRWFDVSTVQFGDQMMNYANDVSAVVQAEMAQRNFVQTLTKTFAQLYIGLAIFDRNRQLALFNPALVDLTALPADFLSSRPNLLSFFDRLRDNRVMPEPKNYSSWREKIADLVAAAADGRYLETWELPMGQTYRVSGRPHPDGAVAFLFEDISAEISLTRRFRSELELGYSVLNNIDQSIAVFSSSGVLTISNIAFREMWGVDPDTSFAEFTIFDAMDLWKTRYTQPELWKRLHESIIDQTNRHEWCQHINTGSGDLIECRCTPLVGGNTMVVFDMLGQRQLTQPPQVTLPPLAD